MATTSIGNGAGGFVAAELIQSLTSDLAKELGANLLSNSKTASTDASQSVGDTAKPVAQPPSGPTQVTDVAAVLMSEVATSDLGKLTEILQPAPNPDENKILDTLLRNAVQEMTNGNAERAIGYLADYATRDPGRAEALPQMPEFEQVSDKIETMVSRMTFVARMSAEDGLSRAEQSTSQAAGKISNWETHADVLLQLAHRLFDSGGYANYSRTAELARLVSDAAEAKPVAQALAASASAASAPMNPMANQLMPGVNVPYWVPPDLSAIRSNKISGKSKTGQARRVSDSPVDDVCRNLSDLKEISTAALRQLWHRVPLLVMMLTWLAVGLSGGIAFVLASRLWPQSIIVAMGNFGFDLWGIGFLALVGFGFYVRVRYRPKRY